MPDVPPDQLARPVSRWTIRRLWVLVPPLGLALSLGSLSHIVDWSATFAAIGEAKNLWLAAGAGLAVLAPLIVSVKLRLLLAALGISRSWRRCWSAVMAALTLNAILPARGGDLFRVVFLKNGPGSVGSLVGAVVLERVLDVLTLSVISFLAAMWIGRQGVVLLAGLLCVGSTCILMALSIGWRVSWLPRKARRTSWTARGFWRRPARAASVCSLCVVGWMNNILILTCVLRAVGQGDVPLVQIVANVPLAILAGIVPISISGIGTRDGVLVMLLAEYAEPSGVLAAAFLYTALVYWFLAGIGLVALGSEALQAVRREALSTRE